MFLKAEQKIVGPFENFRNVLEISGGMERYTMQQRDNS
jgi:hypothetical protein